jgi:hypothetical protein
MKYKNIGVSLPQQHNSCFAAMISGPPSPRLLSAMNKMAQRSGRAPRMPGIAGTQNFQKEAYAAWRE